jgi:predicted Zn-dependent protease with MMP-like domain
MPRLPRRKRHDRPSRSRSGRIGPPGFERLVARAVDGIPEPFRSRLENVAVVVEDRPSRELLASLGMSPGETLLGLYDGIPLTERGDWYNMVPPDRIIIFRLPILEMCRTREEVVEEVRRTVLHEVAHFYGIGDDELDRMGLS